MNAISRGKGTTASERYLAQLADRTFLNLWSYPNVYIDKKSSGKGDGKELCDLLVVCGDHVLIFSDKTVAWPGGDDVGLAWRRWFRRSVKKSADQIRGARRWINEFPDRIFLDPACTQRLPVTLPPIERRKVHGIVVARGAGEVSRQFFGGGIGSLLVVPSIKGDDHVSENGHPLAIGDIDPTGPFIHVFDDATLDIAMHELDTITDLTDYLTKKENLIRSERLIMTPGEEELIAYYMTHTNNAGEHDFTKPDGSPFRAGEVFTLDSGLYESLQRNPQYIAKKEADRDSYVWDKLIEVFTEHMLAGTTLVPDGEQFDLSRHEEGVRHMALVPRYLRRLHGSAILDALEKGRTTDRMTRALLPLPTSRNKETGFFFMTLAVPDLELPGGYGQYRRGRRVMLETYALTFLEKHRNLKRIIGIATEPPRRSGETRGSSEDLILAEQPSEWSRESIDELEKRKNDLNIAREGQYKEYAVHGQEFPEVKVADAPEAQPLNRHQRRVLKAKARKRRKRK